MVYGYALHGGRPPFRPRLLAVLRSAVARSFAARDHVRSLAVSLGSRATALARPGAEGAHTGRTRGVLRPHATTVGLSPHHQYCCRRWQPQARHGGRLACVASQILMRVVSLVYCMFQVSARRRCYGAASAQQQSAEAPTGVSQRASTTTATQ